MRNPRRRVSGALPASLRPLFWDYDIATLRWDRDRDLILGRLLRQGGWSEARLLRSRLGDDAVRDWLFGHEARGLAPQRIRFWQLVLGLPRERADAWVRAARDGPWGQRLAR